jgi:GTPase SAR1 family protein
MGKYAVIVAGPAGSGKSTFCRRLSEHYSSEGRSVHMANFDPAAEDPLPYEPSIDIREMISLDDVMEIQGLGPNGGLVYCMEYTLQGSSWVEETLEDYTDDFLIVDLPGQIELLSHVPVIPMFVRTLQQEGYFVACTFLLDALSVTADSGKFMSGCLLALTAMVNIDVPCINILSKCDLLPKGFPLERYCACEFDFLKMDSLPPKLQNFTKTMCRVVDDFSLVRFLSHSIDIESTANIAVSLDDILQVADDAEVRDRDINDIPE